MLTNFQPSAHALEIRREQAVNVFMEKSVAPDIPACGGLIKAGEEAEKKNLRSPPACNCATARTARS